MILICQFPAFFLLDERMSGEYDVTRYGLVDIYDINTVSTNIPERS